MYSPGMVGGVVDIEWVSHFAWRGNTINVGFSEDIVTVIG